MADLKLPGRPIPYAFSSEEIASFVDENKFNLELQHYLYLKTPPYGIIVKQDYGEILVWYDQTGHLHIIDVTNLSIAREVQKAPYESPDASFIKNLLEELRKIALQAKLPKFELGINAFTLVLVFGILLLIWLLKK
jgi:hypothetical protein